MIVDRYDKEKVSNSYDKVKYACSAYNSCWMIVDRYDKEKVSNSYDRVKYACSAYNSCQILQVKGL